MLRPLTQSMLRPLTHKDFIPFNTKLLTNPYINNINKYRYKGQIKCVILDWSGTLSDAGVLAPAVVFVDVFKKFGIISLVYSLCIYV